MAPTIQDIFELRKNGQFEEAYAAVLPMYREHHGHYTTLCMFWTATDVCRLRIDSKKVVEAEQILASLLNLYPNLQDKDWSAARTLNRLALMLAEKEQQLRDWNEAPEGMQFSLLDYIDDFGAAYLAHEDWEKPEWNGRLLPAYGEKVAHRITKEAIEDADVDRMTIALHFIECGLNYAPKSKVLLRNQATLNELINK